MWLQSSSRLSVAFRSPLCALIAIALPGAASALRTPAPLSDLEEADRKALETIASHPESTRESVLKASLHVDALVETQRIQEQSSASFQDRLGKLDKKQQEQIWEIVREPGLLDELATDERPSRSELDEIAKRHPESLAPAIRSVGAKHHDLLVDIAEIHHRANERFDVAVADLDPEAQQAFRDLVDKPELLSVLVRRVNLVVRLGDSYRKNPKDTRTYLAALSDDVAKRNAAAEKAWKDRIENDPEAAAELDSAARDYAEEQGYDYEELTSPEARTRVTITVNPYPFWFGYPYWYSDVYLYPYGYWYPYAPYFGYYRHHHAACGGDSRRSTSCTGSTGVTTTTTTRIFTTTSTATSPTTITCPGHRFTAANNFIARSDPVGGHRADGSMGRGGRSAGPGGRASVGTASTSRVDRGFLVNRNRSEDGSRGGMRTAPGQAGRALTNPGGGGRLRPDPGCQPQRRARARARAGRPGAGQTGTAVLPAPRRGSAARGRGEYLDARTAAGLVAPRPRARGGRDSRRVAPGAGGAEQRRRARARRACA